MAEVLWKPTAVDVGAILRARTVDAGGNELGTFTSVALPEEDRTRPTLEQVEALLTLATNTVAASVGVTIADENLAGAATHLAAIRAAMLVELTYFPEQVGNDDSPYEALRDLYREELPTLVEAVKEAGADVDDGEPGGTVAVEGTPRFWFPEDEGGMLGWGTKF